MKITLAVSLLLLAAASRAAAGGADYQGFGKIVAELNAKADACGTDREKLKSSAEKYQWALSKHLGWAEDAFGELIYHLRRQGIDVQIRYDASLAATCALSEGAEKFNLGGVEALGLIADASNLSAARRVKTAVEVLIIQISPEKGAELYRLNDASRASVEGGQKTWVVRVNSGDYDTGLNAEDFFARMYAPAESPAPKP